MENTKLEVINLDSDKDKGNAWEKARLLSLNRTIENTTPEKFYEIVNTLDDYKDKALIILAYFTAGRIEEIVRYQKIKWGKKKVILIKNDKRKKATIQDWEQRQKIGELKDGIAKRDIREQTIKGVNCLIINLRNLKNRIRKNKELPIRLDREFNYKLYKILETYLKTIQFEYQELFPFGVRNAQRIINKINWNPHSLRKLRLTHLVIYEGYTDQKLTYYAGWTDSRPAKHYIKMKPEDLI
jgi:hypothetical protein